MRRPIALLALYFFILATAHGQTITGSIVGSLKDPAGLAVARAEIKLVQTATGVTRQARSNDHGDFSFPSLPPGDYSLTKQTSLKLSASETLPVGDLTLDVGSVAETIQVTAQGAVVQTASSERSGVITSSQVENIQSRGRNAMNRRLIGAAGRC